MNYLDMVLKSVKEPPLNTVVFNLQNGIIFPCVVKSGRFNADSGRLSNFWEWINLCTGEKQSGYGNFFIAIEKEK